MCLRALNRAFKYHRIIIFIIFLFFQFQEHQIGKFSNIIDLKKLDFLRSEKISDHSGFVNKELIQ